jgi:hypothetical protein
MKKAIISVIPILKDNSDITQSERERERETERKELFF